ncbi:MAG TPA: nucleotidyltransferase domain-containing protein [bacterium]
MDKRNQELQKLDQKSAIELARKYLAYLKLKNIDVQKAFIYGSYAKNNYQKDSDIDLAIVLKNLSNSFLMQVELMILSRKIDTRIEPHPYDESDFNTSNSSANEILKQGIAVL